jgi:uncharacterized protein YdbL (DUF1318 family)
MKTYIVLITFLILSLGCARVRVEAPKEAIKVDISMRLDIYQHVQKDIDEIENIVSGSKEKPKAANNTSLNYFVATAYAQEGFAPEVEEAALRRKDRRSELTSWEARGVVGENRSGLVEIRDAASATDALAQLVNSENTDRMIIYRAVAEKNGTSVEEVQKLYAQRLKEDAPSGTPIESVNSAGNYEWRIK